ncbi:ATP-dependent DNA helicase RecQ [Aphanizomenon flos-aquae NRERC-008]|jgi:ATP-dependent DNA helicase RecQ|uniref:ATP-dependent DNA helicase RecQ n=1 Tax=Aphanizomenon flos-aquae FACHB-1249 TaxID=2692889 RepID=A0ABR8IVM5_APHFL|nr:MULTISPECIES: ATP-dependent DNA helicase RecQ [Aphanizomenon]MBD2391814.1 ATP-dependent DNA helicase RecQ [Aphanizomenon flos-aquae FACHB-1171]MBD2558472.1 ATP-dependent DNA helicase RecQ [Aphanizomenon flos-aquae FACHB-1290]MBD2632723.1 ATP-dependent DNA helicase RecQ [Aphanizomenon sp. FACHB-1399]MBD2643542.1 ATP-dependent DNA helicase RecQ [Aphanizomenon sp. FACHB-1401]MBD2658423.1 ATP-dependent DNA helicase RecQ [Aphanizomenon flos-aquae FACHB-1265]
MNLPLTQSDHDVRAALKTIWGYDDFRPPQKEIVNSLILQKDALIIMPTGGGKSICFQLPALLKTGLTLVISPLVALMENQVEELRQKQQKAGLLHSELPALQRQKTLQALEKKELRLLYLSPETLLSPIVWQKLSNPQLQINGLILDEAHCLVQWGDTFRPAYRRLGTAREALLKSKPPGTKISIAAFTATADPLAQKIISQVLKLDKPDIFKINPYRQNLNPIVRIAWTPKGRKQQLLNFIQKRPKQVGLIYVRTRKDSEYLSQWLIENGYQTASYHAGLSPAERRNIEANWLGGKILFVVCTCAFGMGINKSDVRWVVHFHAPHLLSEYVQEIGRAGRDGKPADVLTLVSEPTGFLDSGDKQRQKFFEQQLQLQQQKARKLVKKLPPQGEINSVIKEFPDSAVALSLLHSNGQLEWLDPFHYSISSQSVNSSKTQLQAGKQMTSYLTIKQCRWRFLLNAFGFEIPTVNWCCGHCDNCKN